MNSLNMGGRRASITKALAMPLRIRKGSTTTARAQSSEVQIDEAQRAAASHPERRKDSMERSETNLRDSPLLSLPVELFLDISHLLCPEEVVNLQLSCKKLHHIVSVQQEALVSIFLKKYGRVRLALEVYSCTALPRVLPRLKDLIALTHRVNLVDKLVRHLLTEILNEAYGQDISLWAQQPARRKTYQDAIQDIEPYFLPLGHFLESFRANFVYLLSGKFDWDSHDALPLLLSSWALRHYTSYASIRVCLAYRDLMNKLARKLRPPSYANAAERGLRGWTRDPAKPEDCRDIAVFGGLHAVYQIMSISGYRHRMRAMDRVLLEQSGRLGKGDLCTMATPTMLPLDRRMSKTLHAHLHSRNSPLLAHNNALLREFAGVGSDEAELFRQPVHYDAGFGCHVFTAGYHPDTSSSADAEADESLPLIANPPRQGPFPIPSLEKEVSRLNACLPRAIGRPSPSTAREGDIEGTDR